jgi:hypothetical protein
MSPTTRRMFRENPGTKLFSPKERPISKSGTWRRVSRYIKKFGPGTIELISARQQEGLEVFLTMRKLDKDFVSAVNINNVEKDQGLCWWNVQNAYYKEKFLAVYPVFKNDIDSLVL